VVAAAILVFSLTPRLFKPPLDLSLSDKVEHGASYAVLGAAAYLNFRRKDAAGFLLALGACSAYGGVIEIVQPLAGRTRDILDFIADVLGTALGEGLVLLAAAIRQAAMRRSQPRQ
jgi:VanZ family protein